MLKRVLNFKEACEYLHFSQNYLYKLTSAGIVPYSKPTGGRIYFDREKLDAWLLSNSNKGECARDIEASTYVTTNPR